MTLLTQEGLAQSRDVVWYALDVVSYLPEDFQRVAAAAAREGLVAGERLPLESPLLDRACDRIKLAFTDRSAVCHKLLQGEGKALFVVQFETSGDREAQSLCSSAQLLPSSAVEALSQWQDTVRRLLQSPDVDPTGFVESVNDQGFLDYKHPQLHEAAGQLHAAVSSNIDLVEASANSCDAEQRGKAITLLNYAGDPRRALRSAVPNMSNQSELVRNESLRLVSTFFSFMDERARVGAVGMYCELLSSNSFFDRNKALAGLVASLEADPLLESSITLDCLAKVRAASELSQSDQIGGYARAIIRLVD